jgi:hypothetical protein
MANTLYHALVAIWFLLYAASMCLALHMVVARYAETPDSRVLAFFAALSRRVTRPVRVLLPIGTSEPRVRAIALGAFLALMVVTHVAFYRLGGDPLGGPERECGAHCLPTLPSRDARVGPAPFGLLV